MYLKAAECYSRARHYGTTAPVQNEGGPAEPSTCHLHSSLCSTCQRALLPPGETPPAPSQRPGWDRNGGTKWVKRACSADARKRQQARLGHTARSHLGSPLPSVTCPLGCRISLQVAPRSQASRAQRCSCVCCSAVIKQVFPGHQTGARHQGIGGWRDG